LSHKLWHGCQNHELNQQCSSQQRDQNCTPSHECNDLLNLKSCSPWGMYYKSNYINYMNTKQSTVVPNLWTPGVVKGLFQRVCQHTCSLTEQCLTHTLCVLIVVISKVKIHLQQLLISKQFSVNAY
jgi:hypothetical protein